MNVSNSTSSFISKSYPTYTNSKGTTFGFFSGTAEELMAKIRSSKTPPEKLLYNGSTERAPLSGEQLAELAREYDPTNMTQEQYRDFLDDLQGMGVISEMEKTLMDYNKGIRLMGYVDAEGDYIETDCRAYVRLGDEGNLQKTLGELNEQGVSRGVCACGDEAHHTEQFCREVKKSEEQAEKRLSLMTAIVNNMMEYRRIHNIPSGKQNAAETEPAEETGSLMEQANDPGGEFWLNLRNMIIDNAREKRKQAAEEAELEMLDLMLESAVGQGKSRSAAMEQLRLMRLTREVNEYGYREFHQRTRN